MNEAATMCKGVNLISHDAPGDRVVSPASCQCSERQKLVQHLRSSG